MCCLLTTQINRVIPPVIRVVARVMLRDVIDRLLCSCHSSSLRCVHLRRVNVFAGPTLLYSGRGGMLSAVVSSAGELSAKWFQVFEAYSDGHLRVLNSLFPPVVARFVQLKPITWQKRASAAIQLLGCPVVTDTTKTVSSVAGEHILFPLYWSNPG